MASFYITIAIVCFMGAFTMGAAKFHKARAFVSVSNITRKQEVATGESTEVAGPDPCDISKIESTFPNIDYAFAGYDSVAGYPLSKGRDPGFRNAIFKAEYTSGKPNGDCRYKLPKGIIAVPDVSCDISFKSDVVHSTAQLHDSLSASANIEGGGWGFEFSASASYKKSSSEISSKEFVYVISKAKCTAYFSRIEVADHPPFDEGFLAKAEMLAKKSVSEDDVNKFIETYGTHFLDEVTFGSSFTHEHRMSSSAYESLSESSFGVSVQASYSGLFSAGGGFSLDSEQQEAASTFSKKVETSTITVGSAPPDNGDAMTWAAASRENPVPVSYLLRPIADLFTDRFFDSDSDFRYSRVHNRLQDAAQKSCEIQKSKGVSVSCLNPRNFGETQVVAISGGYPRLLSDETEFVNSFSLGSQRDCELMCAFNKECVGYTSVYEEVSVSGSCEIVKEGGDYEWSNYGNSDFTLYFNKMVNDLVVKTNVPKVVEIAEPNNRLLFAYYQDLNARPAAGQTLEQLRKKNLKECRKLCVHDPKCKAIRFGKCHNEVCNDMRCYVFHDISSLSPESLSNTEFHFVAK